MNEPSDKPVTFRVPDDIMDVVRAYASANDMTMSQVMRKVLREFVASTK